MLYLHPMTNQPYIDIPTINSYFTHTHYILLYNFVHDKKYK